MGNSRLAPRRAFDLADFMRPALALLVLLLATPLRSAPPAIHSPEVLPDRRVTFRVKLPKAHEVKVQGDQHLEVTLTKGEDDLWSATVGPLEPSVYGYSLVVDGLSILDPGNPWFKPEPGEHTSAFLVPGEPPLLHERQDTPHGVLHLHEYTSAPSGVVRRLRVYTPPGYEHQVQRGYPVLYLLHGSGDNEATWSEFGRAHVILDNLIAQKKAVSMIVVMPDGHMPSTGGQPAPGERLKSFELDVLENILPLVEHTYRVKAGPTHRAICGLSMGGVQSFSIGLRHPDFFAWVGGMSAFVPDAETLCAEGLNDPKINEKFALFWDQIGKDDMLLKKNEEFEAVLDKHSIKHHYQLTEGSHAWPVWRNYLAEFAPLLFQE